MISFLPFSTAREHPLRSVPPNIETGPLLPPGASWLPEELHGAGISPPPDSPEIPGVPSDPPQWSADGSCNALRSALRTKICSLEYLGLTIQLLPADLPYSASLHAADPSGNSTVPVPLPEVIFHFCLLVGLLILLQLLSGPGILGIQLFLISGWSPSFSRKKMFLIHPLKCSFWICQICVLLGRPSEPKVSG